MERLISKGVNPLTMKTIVSSRTEKTIDLVKSCLTLFVLTLTTFSVLGQDCESKFKFYSLRKTIRTGVRITEEKIIAGELKAVEPSYLNDAQLVLKVLNFVPTSDSLLLPEFDGIDVRLLLQFDDACPVKTLGISGNGLLSVNGDRVYSFKPDSLIALLKNHIPPNLEWYDVDSEYLKEYQRKKYLEELEKGY